MFKWSGWNKYTRNKLNQIANGSGGGDGSGGSGGNIMVIRPANIDRHRFDNTFDSTTYVNLSITVDYDKTWQEVYDALAADIPVYLDVTVFKIAEYEQDFFNVILNDSDKIKQTYATFKHFADHIVSKVPVVEAASPLYGSDADNQTVMRTTYTIDTAADVIENVDGIGTGYDGGPNDPLHYAIDTCFPKPSDYPDEEQ